VSDDELGKTIIMCNHDDANSILAALVMGAAAAATGEQVLLFFQPGAANALVKGELEKFQGLKGQPDPIMLYESIQILDGRFIFCELGMPIHDIKEEDLREGVEVMMASSFLFEAENANWVFSY
jgi:predicted peroxiredoxin